MTKQNDHNKEEKYVEEYGRYLEGGKITDSTLLSLQEIKNEVLSSSGAQDKEKVWAAIREQLHPDDKVGRLFYMSGIRKWAIAASVVLATLMGIYIFYTPSQETLVYQTEASIEQVHFPDGSEVVMRPYSRLYKMKESDTNYHFRIEGEAFFQVVKNPGRSFSVTANQGVITVVGTRFNVSSWGKEARVYLEEGTVEFKNQATDEKVVLAPGEYARISETPEIEIVQNVNPDQFTDWQQNKLIFQEQNLKTIVYELEQHFNISVWLPQQMKDVTLSGELSLNTPGQVLDYIGVILDVSFESTGKNTYRLVPKNNNN